MPNKIVVHNGAVMCGKSYTSSWKQDNSRFLRYQTSNTFHGFIYLPLHANLCINFNPYVKFEDLENPEGFEIETCETCFGKNLDIAKAIESAGPVVPYNRIKVGSDEVDYYYCREAFTNSMPNKGEGHIVFYPHSHDLNGYPEYSTNTELKYFALRFGSYMNKVPFWHFIPSLLDKKVTVNSIAKEILENANKVMDVLVNPIVMAMTGENPNMHFSLAPSQGLSVNYDPSVFHVSWLHHLLVGIIRDCIVTSMYYSEHFEVDKMFFLAQTLKTKEDAVTYVFKELIPWYQKYFKDFNAQALSNKVLELEKKLSIIFDKKKMEKFAELEPNFQPSSTGKRPRYWASGSAKNLLLIR